jgi:hypothetical protein
MLSCLLTQSAQHSCSHSGTTRLQLEKKGDDGQYTDFANIIVAFACLGIPTIGWLLDKKVCKCLKSAIGLCQHPNFPFSLQGYGTTLGTINGLNVLSSILQAVPNLQIQVLTLLTWMISRFFMYSRCYQLWPVWHMFVVSHNVLSRRNNCLTSHRNCLLQLLCHFWQFVRVYKLWEASRR